MTESPRNRRLCDYCGSSAALLFCRADSAKLCFACDREVHSTNQLFSKHIRSLLCNACDSSPASIFCESEHCVFCQNCDWERHSFSSSSCLHNRRPIEGFNGCPSVSELLTVFGFEDAGNKGLILGGDGVGGDGVEGFEDMLLWETPEVVSLNDLIASTGTEHRFQAMVVPSLPKNRNATCGQHRLEILQQLCELAKSDPNLNYDCTDIESLFSGQSLMPEEALLMENAFEDREQNVAPLTNPAHEVESIHLISDSRGAVKQLSDSSTVQGRNLQESSLAADKHSEFASGLSPLDADKHSEFASGLSHNSDSIKGQAQHFNKDENSSVLPKATSTELNNSHRDSAITRYKEKRKTRRYEKVVRYESRKARAESRTRVRGRFAKVVR